MKNIIKKVLAIVVCTVIVFGFGKTVAKAAVSEMDAYAQDIIDDMLLVNGYKDFDGITISSCGMH